MVEEILHASEVGPSDPMRFLVLASFIRNDLPWLYELAVDAYRETIHLSSRANSARRRFVAALKGLRHGPFLDMMGDRDTFMFVRDIEHYVIDLDLKDLREDRLPGIAEPKSQKPIKPR
jgi:hypothetical protein